MSESDDTRLPASGTLETGPPAHRRRRGPGWVVGVAVVVALLLCVNLLILGMTRGREGRPQSGVRGIVVVAPFSSVVRVGVTPQASPLVAMIDVVNASGHTVAQVASAADGRFEVPLEAGRYTLRATGPNPRGLPIARPVQVTVPRKGWVRVTVQFDSGIR